MLPVGLIDADYAMSMYDTFVESFNNSNIEGENIIPGNPDNPDTFEEINDDEKYVEGRWDGTTHQKVVDEAFGEGNIDSLDTKAIAIIKLGAIYPDKKEINVRGYGNYPEYHGGVKWDKVPDKEVVPVNYVSCYTLLTKIARKGGDTSAITKVEKGMDKRVFDKIKSKISTTKFGDWTWSKILSQYGNTKTNRKYFLFGVAIHLVSDSYAHRIWYKDNGVVGKYMKHPDADDPTKCVNRLSVTRETVWYVMACADINCNGGYVDIAWGLEKFNNTFARENLYPCFLEVAGNDPAFTDICDVKKIKKASYIQKKITGLNF